MKERKAGEGGGGSGGRAGRRHRAPSLPAKPRPGPRRPRPPPPQPGGTGPGRESSPGGERLLPLGCWFGKPLRDGAVPPRPLQPPRAGGIPRGR